MRVDEVPSGWTHAIAIKIANAEAFAGLLLSTFVFLVVIGIGGGCMLILEWMGGRGSMHWTLTEKVGATVVYVVFLTCEVGSLTWITRGLQQRRSPRAVWLALSQRDLGRLTNALIVAWWLLHVASILAVGLGLDLLISGIGRSREIKIVSHSIGMMTMFAAAYMTSSFLVLAVGAWSRREITLRRVWRLRGLIDTLLALGVLVLTGWT
jgi:hypothetical protein